MFTRKTILASASAIALAGMPAAPVQAQGIDPYIGQMLNVGYTFCPRGWFSAEGQLLPIGSYSTLFSLLGTNYGGDGRTTFGLPDLRGRTPLGQGTGAGLPAYALGQTGGVESVTLTANEMPSHTHVTAPEAYLPTSSQAPDTNSPDGNSLGTHPAGNNVYFSGTPDLPGMVVNGTIAIGTTGGSQPHTNMGPYLVTRWCIASQGVYPSRN